MNAIDSLLSKNKDWVEKIEREHPGFFQTLSKQQNPDYLWIGCSDSRVPANVVAGLLPGEVFVHRNVANQVIQTDLNCLSVIEYAIRALKVKHIIVCGHYGCGGVKAALLDEKNGLVDNWLRNLRNAYLRHRHLFEDVPDQQAQIDLLCELNVFKQVRNVCQTTVVQDAWADGHQFSVHGMIYGISDGLLKNLNISVSSADEIPDDFEVVLSTGATQVATI